MKNKSLFLLLCLIAFMSACSGGEKNEKKQLVLGVMPSMDYLPVAVAARENYFASRGLDLKIVKFYSANERDAALQSGSIDGAVIDYTGALLQKNGGVDIALTSRCDAPFFVISGPASGIVDLLGLKGASIAVSQNTVIDYLLDMALRSVGLTEADVRKVEINKIPVRFEMLMGGKVEATGLPNPLAMLAENGGAHLLGSNATLDLSITGIVFTGQARRDKAALIQKMYQGYNQGVEYLLAHGATDISGILIDEMGFKPELAAQAQLSVYGRAALPPAKDLQSVVDWLNARGLLRQDLDLNSLSDGSFLPQ